MNGTALILGPYSLRWPGLFAALGCACAMLLALGLWMGRGRSAAGLMLFLGEAALLGLVAGRLGHWYCHPMQYASLREAMTDYLRGGFSLWGSFGGVLLAAALFAAGPLSPGAGELLDLLSPAAALGIAVGRLGSAFDLSDRGKFAVADPRLHRLPFAVYTSLAGEEGQWRFATFFLQSLFCLGLCLVLLALLRRTAKKGEHGLVALFFALFYSAGQILLDSTRYDGDYFRFNGFIHVPQLLAALAAAGALAVLLIRSVRRWGFRRGHGWLLASALLCFAGCGGMEYLSQRRVGSYALAYGVMALLLALLCAVGAVLALWRPGSAGKTPQKPEVPSD